jgi:hypothetical protein
MPHAPQRLPPSEGYEGWWPRTSTGAAHCGDLTGGRFSDSKTDDDEGASCSESSRAFVHDSSARATPIEVARTEQRSNLGGGYPSLDNQRPLALRPSPGAPNDPNRSRPGIVDIKGPVPLGAYASELIRTLSSGR